MMILKNLLNIVYKKINLVAISKLKDFLAERIEFLRITSIAGMVITLKKLPNSLYYNPVG